MPGEIISAKLGAVLIGLAVFSLPFWPLLLPCTRWNLDSGDASTNGVTWLQAILCFGLIAATAICYTLWGMFWSWRCRKTSAAVGWTLGSLFFILVFVPIFFAIGFGSSSSGWEDLIWVFHPFVALALIGEERKAGVSAAAVTFLLLAGGVLWIKLRNELRQERS